MNPNVSLEKESHSKDEWFFENIRRVDYSRVDKLKQVYFDYTGGNLYPESLVKDHYEFLQNNVLGNPHSINPTSKLATEKVEDARKKVLEYFNATDDYYCVFTANASAALKIVGECYPFCEESELALFSDNHNSVNGLREFCKSKQGAFDYIPMNFKDLTVDKKKFGKVLKRESNCTDKLLAFPAQSNVSGVQHDLGWIKKAQDLGWDVLLDAAAFVPTNKLDLKKYQPNFVSISFYKMFGFPTGIGCLFIGKDTFNKLKKPWFAGGTVAFAAVSEPMHMLVKNHERFEDGTINYLHIPAIKNGLDYIDNIGIENIHDRVESHTTFLLKTFAELKHGNGEPLIGVYGPKSTKNRGGTIIFNVLKENGEPYPFTEVENRANNENISIRTGCFCNPGIDEITHCLSTEDIAKYYSVGEDATYLEMINFLGKMRGAVRISVGYVTNQKDLDTLICFLKTFSA